MKPVSENPRKQNVKDSPSEDQSELTVPRLKDIQHDMQCELEKELRGHANLYCSYTSNL